MTDAPPSPRARRLSVPGRLDRRLVLGVLLVLVSVVLGARVLADADRSTVVYAAARDLAPGTVLTADDLVPARVRLFDSSRLYAGAAGASPAGYVLRQGVGRGELLPAAALARPGEEADLRLVSLPVQAGHYPPDLRGGQQVDVYVTPEEPLRAASGAAPATSPPPGTAPDPTGTGAPGSLVTPGAPRLPLDTAQQVLAGLTVVGVSDAGAGFGGGSAVGDRVVTVQVSPRSVVALLSAVSAGRVDLVRVPRADEVAAPLAPATAR